MHRLAVYLDMDGVLADFDAGLRARGIAPIEDLNRSREEMTPGQRAAKEALQAQIAHWPGIRLGQKPCRGRFSFTGSG